MTNEIAERYAQGFFELARETVSVEERKKDAELVYAALEATPELMTFLRAVKITKEEKKDLIENVFGGSVGKNTVNFIKLLIDKGRISYFREILKEFINLSNSSLGITTAVVESARELKSEDLERIRKALEKKTGNSIVMTTKINPELIAGIKVTVGNNVTDITTKKRIESMKEALLKGGQA